MALYLANKSQETADKQSKLFGTKSQSIRANCYYKVQTSKVEK